MAIHLPPLILSLRCMSNKLTGHITYPNNLFALPLLTSSYIPTFLNCWLPTTVSRSSTPQHGTICHQSGPDSYSSNWYYSCWFAEWSIHCYNTPITFRMQHQTTPLKLGLLAKAAMRWNLLPSFGQKNTFWLVSYPMLLGKATVHVFKHTYAWDDNRRQRYQLCVSSPLWSDRSFQEICCRLLAKKITFWLVSYPMLLGQATVHMSKHTYA
jgi:hypothetical protein